MMVTRLLALMWVHTETFVCPNICLWNVKTMVTISYQHCRSSTHIDTQVREPCLDALRHANIQCQHYVWHVSRI